MASMDYRLWLDASEIQPMLAELKDRIRAVGGIAAAEEILMRPLDQRFFKSLFELKLGGVSRVVPTEEFDRALLALWRARR